VWLPPPKYRKKEACNQDNYPDANLYPVPDRRGMSATKFAQGDRIETKNVNEFANMESIDDILHKVADEVGTEAAEALSKAFGLDKSPRNN
jgi:hypothetical protein